MKKLKLLLMLLMFPLLLLASEVDPQPWWQTWEFWSVVLAAILLVIEWVLKAIPTTKPVGFILQAVVWIINKLLNTVNDRKKGGGVHKSK